MCLLAKGFADIAGEYGLPLYTCAEAVELSEYGIRHAACIDSAKVERIAGYPIRVERDPGQRPACGCAASVDVGVYNTCPNGCTYCFSHNNVQYCRLETGGHICRIRFSAGLPL